MKIARLLLLLMLIALTACNKSDSPCANFNGGGRYCLQPTIAVAAFDVQQKIKLRFGERHETLIVELEVDALGLRFVALTPLGQKLVQMSYDNHAVSTAASPNARLDPNLLLALLQLALWPPEVVRAGLQGPLTLEENTQQRRILNATEPILTIDYRGAQRPYGQMHIALHAAQLELDIETLDTAPLQ